MMGVGMYADLKSNNAIITRKNERNMSIRFVGETITTVMRVYMTVYAPQVEGDENEAAESWRELYRVWAVIKGRKRSLVGAENDSMNEGDFT